jgi:hypothetical protein
MAADKQDANLVGFYKIREATLGVTPATGVWATREPNTFDDLGGDYTKVARRPFSPSRQRKKGQLTDLDADGGYNEDLTQTNMQTEFEEFFFANIRPTGAGDPSEVSGTEYTVALDHGIQTGSIVKASGFGVAANNGVKMLTSAGATTLAAAGLAVEASPPANAVVKEVGFQFATADADISIAGGRCILGSTVADFTTMPLLEGGWVFVAFDDDNIGFARIAVNGITATALTFDKTTWTPVADDGTGVDAAIYFSDILRNEPDPDDIVRFSSTFERTLGRDDVGVQSENLTGAIASEMTWTSPLANLVTIDMGYMALRSKTRTGTEGPLSARASNTRAPSKNEEAFNTSSNVYRLRMAVVSDDTLNPTPYFARVTEWNGTINNNVSGAKAQGVLGSFDMVVGNFDFDLELTAYFSTVEAIRAVETNESVTFDAIYAKQNAGLYIDLPLLTLGGGRLEIEQDAAIMLPLESPAAESPFGHTALVGWFPYLPDEAMPG